MRNSLWCLLFVPVLVASCTHKSTDSTSAAGPPKAQSVGVMIVKMAPLTRKIVATGSLLANEEIQIKPEVSGRITAIHFAEGEQVSAGQLLIKIDDSELQGELKKTLIETELAKEDEARKKKLLEANGISKEDYDAALNHLQQLVAEKELIQTRIDKTNITAPFNGTIGLRYFSEGGYVSPADLIASLQQTNQLKIDFSVPEKYASQLKKNAAVHFTVEGDTNNYTAAIYAKEPAIDPDSRTVKVRAVYQNANNKLLPGAFAKLEIDLGTNEEAITVPSQSIIPGLTGQSVMCIKNGKVALTPVTIGLREASDTEVTKGLTPGDTVITTGLLTVRDGMPVKALSVNTEIKK